MRIWLRSAIHDDHDWLVGVVVEWQMSACMLAGFALYQEQPLPPRNCIVGMPIGARALRLVRLMDGWRLWLATRDYKHGTYVDMHDDGSVWNITTRADEGDECWLARPSDAEIRSML